MTEHDWRIAVEIAAAARIKEAKLEGLCKPEWFGFAAERDMNGMELYRDNITAAPLPMFRALACTVACLWATYACEDTPEARFVSKTYARILEKMGTTQHRGVAWQLSLQAMSHAHHQGMDLDKYEPFILMEDEVLAELHKRERSLH